MTEIDIRIDGCAGRITLQRPKALNALTYAMIPAISAALDGWATDDAVKLVLIDAEGDKAFCAGGDIADLYRTGTAGDFAFGQGFWHDEYRLNAKLAEYPKPIVSFMQGFTMGGGVGIGCHASHRVVGAGSQIAMPECGIGLVPDVGGSMLLARAPGHLGEYLGATCARMGPGDAIRAGFADYFLPEDAWPALKPLLCSTGTLDHLTAAVEPTPAARYDTFQAEIDQHFGHPNFAATLTSLRGSDSDFAAATLKSLCRNSPLSMACAMEMAQCLRPNADIRAALSLEYRFTARAMQHGDFLEGIRAAIIDKDRTPNWKHPLDDVPVADIKTMLAPLGDTDLRWKDTP